MLIDDRLLEAVGPIVGHPCLISGKMFIKVELLPQLYPSAAAGIRRVIG
jgi:hypothetical protein